VKTFHQEEINYQKKVLDETVAKFQMKIKSFERKCELIQDETVALRCTIKEKEQKHASTCQQYYKSLQDFKIKLQKTMGDLNKYKKNYYRVEL